MNIGLPLIMGLVTVVVVSRPWRVWHRGSSRTGEVVALVRAEFDRPHSPEGDPDAQRRICKRMRPIQVPRLRPHMAARTRFFDGQVQTAIARGVDQIVICGAGYDDRALRFRTTGVRFFELDHPDTQRLKARRLNALDSDTTALTLAPADFSTDDVAAILADSGQEAARPTLFICEGLLVYLDQMTIVSLLAGLEARAALGSTLAASLSVHQEDADSNLVTAAANSWRRAGRSEPWRTILPVGAHLALLERAGWRVDQAIDAAELADGVDVGTTLLVTAHPDRFGGKDTSVRNSATDMTTPGATSGSTSTASDDQDKWKSP